MAKFCLLKPQADKLKQAAINGEIVFADMFEMTSEQRRKMFQKYVDGNTAVQLNAQFEQAMISEQTNALKNWAKKTFSGSEVGKKKLKDIYEKVNELEQQGILTADNQDSFLEDLVAVKAGASLTLEETNKIVELANKLEEAAGKSSKFNTPTLEYFKAKREMQNYIDSIEPSPVFRVWSETVGRGTMLLSFKSTLLNIESNTIGGLLQAAERRLTTRTIGGVVDGLTKEYRDFAIDVYKQTGYDITRMQSLGEEGKVLGEERITAQGEGLIRKWGRFYEDIVFKQLLGLPDVVYSSVHFADSANITATLIARSEGLKGEALVKRASEIFLDATSIDPQTPQGQKVREQAIADAEFATYTNQSKYSDLALGLRNILNKATGDLRLGTQLDPFVKTPANVVGYGVESSGILIPFKVAKAVINTYNRFKSGENLKDITKDELNKELRFIVRAGLGITFAYMLASLFDPDDFIGEYPTTEKERELLRLNNGLKNSVKIGGKWYSLDYFGALGTPFVAMMYARKYGEGDAGKIIYNYYLGAGTQLLKLPTIENINSIIEGVQSYKFGEAEEFTKDIQKAVQQWAVSRIIPAIIYDVSKATDQYERETNPDRPLDAIKAQIPYIRQSLPARITVLGNEVKTEDAWSVLLFGARVKTANQDEVILELNRLASTGNLPSISEPAKTSKRFKQLKEQIGEERFYNARRYFGVSFYEAIKDEITSYGWSDYTDEEKVQIINKIKQDIADDTLFEFDYEEPEEE